MSLRRAVFAASAAAAAGALLIGSGATYAAWSDSAESDSTVITAGSLTADIQQQGPSNVAIGKNPSIVVDPGSNGLVPGVQAQRWTYTVTNSNESATAAEGTLDLAGAASNMDDYRAMRPYLRAAATVDGKKQDVPNSSFAAAGFAHSVDLGKKLAPGDSTTVTVDLSMPATAANSSGKTVNVANELLNRRSPGSDVQPVFTMKNSVQLEQAGKP